jgi:hypothetical protein
MSDPPDPDATGTYHPPLSHGTSPPDLKSRRLPDQEWL